MPRTRYRGPDRSSCSSPNEQWNMATQNNPEHGAETSTEKASETAGRVTERTRAEASETARQTQEEATRLSEQARDQIATQAEQQKERATDQLEDIGSALHETSSTLRDREQDSVANFVEGTAHQIERLSEYLRTHSVNDMVSEVEHFARREPELFLGGAALLGLVGARFFKSSSPERERRGRYRTAPRGEYATHEVHRPRPSRREERGRPAVAGTSGAEMPDPPRPEESRTEPNRP